MSGQWFEVFVSPQTERQLRAGQFAAVTPTAVGPYCEPASLVLRAAPSPVTAAEEEAAREVVTRMIYDWWSTAGDAVLLGDFGRLADRIIAVLGAAPEPSKDTHTDLIARWQEREHPASAPPPPGAPEVEP